MKMKPKLDGKKGGNPTNNALVLQKIGESLISQKVDLPHYLY